jgi:hypothetical protein
MGFGKCTGGARRKNFGGPRLGLLSLLHAAARCLMAKLEIAVGVLRTSITPTSAWKAEQWPLPLAVRLQKCAQVRGQSHGTRAKPCTSPFSSVIVLRKNRCVGSVFAALFRGGDSLLGRRRICRLPCSTETAGPGLGYWVLSPSASS